MAQPRKLPNGKYRSEVMLGGNRHSKTFDLKRDATAWLNQVKTDYTRGVFIPPDRSREKVADRLDAWLDTRQQSPNLSRSTHVNYETAVRLHIKPYLGRLTLEHLGVEAVERWRDQLVQEKGTACAKESMKVLSAFLTDQHRYGYVPENVVRKVDYPHHTKRQRKPLEPWELSALVEAIRGQSCHRRDEHGRPHVMTPDHPDYGLRSGWAADIVLGLALIGCRIGDLAALRDGHWDRMGQRLEIFDHKSKRPRHIPVFVEVEDILRRCVARGGEFLFMTDGRKGQGRLWPAFNHDFFKPALRGAGITKYVVPHSLRHTCASWLIRKGFGPAQVAAYLGHSSPRVTLEIYAQEFEGDMADMGEAMEQMWAEAQRQRSERDGVTDIRDRKAE